MFSQEAGFIPGDSFEGTTPYGADDFLGANDTQVLEDRHPPFIRSVTL